MYLTSSYQKIKEIGPEKTLSMGAGCDKLFEAISAIVDNAATSV